MKTTELLNDDRINPLLLAQCGQVLKPDMKLDPSIVALLLRVSETYNRFDIAGGQNALTAETSGRLVRLKLLEQILRVMSHDLRSPANNITGLCNLIAGADPSEISVHLKMLSKAASNLIETIADLDAIVGALDGTSSAYETVDLKDLLDDVINSIDGKADATFEFDLEVNQIETVHAYLFSILHNLIQNAIKYRKPAVKPVVLIRTRNAGDEFYEIVVKDNGLGIDLSKYGDRVFGLYEKFNTSIAGKGLGLFLVKTHAENLGGRVTLKSDGNGSEFTVLLPAPSQCKL